MIGIGEYTPLIGGYVVNEFGRGQVVVPSEKLSSYLGEKVLSHVELFLEDNPKCKKFSIEIVILPEDKKRTCDVTISEVLTGRKDERLDNFEVPF